MNNTSQGPESRDSASLVSDDGYYFSVSTDTLNPDTNTGFPIYLKRGSRYVLYASAHDLFTLDLKQRLVQSGIETVYIPLDNQASYESYVIENLEDILNNPEIPDDVRTKVFLDTTAGQVKEIFETRTPCLDNKVVDGVHHVVKSSLSFLLTPAAMENIRRFLSHDYQTFSHSVHVFTYTMMLMNYMSEDWDEETLVNTGVGALLHDIGKTKIPASVLNKPGRLDESEWIQIKQHPRHGTSMCTNVWLPHTSLDCIRFHHEKFDGSGYPAGIKKDEIPVPARVITCCDVYDAITSKRPYAPAEPPFEALRIMGGKMKGSFDPDIFRSFIQLLGWMSK